MFRRKRNLPLKVALVVVLLFALAIQASTAGNEYRVVLRFYDDVQITYTITYPASVKPETGSQRLPIGGVGTPGSGKLDISSYVSKQIYCVDPFTPFHGNIEDLKGHPSNVLLPGEPDVIYADEIIGYVSAAPWAMSGAMQYYSDAVRWIAANGYRGKYDHDNSVGDSESEASVARLQLLFGDITPIDRQIAIMATKVAIWKIIAPDSVVVESTSLDDDEDRLAAFDALWRGLVEKAKEQLEPGSKSPPASPEVTVTQFTLEIIESPLSDYYVDKNEDYNFIGPLTVKATLTDAVVSTMPNLGKVFLAPSGLNTGGVCFVSEVADEDDFKSALLPGGPDDDPLYGTNRHAQYVTGSVGTGVEANTWESDEFYVAVPKTRTDPPRSDQILVTAMAKAPDIEVLEGTPIVFAFELDDVQDWYAIQAFIGGASKDAIVDLYAEAKWNSGNTSIGELYVQKVVKDGDVSNDNDAFTFTLYYNTSNKEAQAPALDRNKKLNLNDFTVVGVNSRTESNFTLKNGGIAIISGLPMVVDIDGEGKSGFYEYYYWIEETSKTGYGTPHFILDIGATKGQEVNRTIFGPFKLDAEVYDLGYVTVTNKVSTPYKPNRPNNPDNPDEPDEPDEPDTPETPTTPGTPDTPDTPDRPDTPDTPDTPGTPGIPGTPDTPTIPIDPWGPPFGRRDPSTGDNRDPTSAIAMIMLGINFIMLAEITRRIVKRKSRKTRE